eukprot:scaffold85982_cov36-Phaeocystis_antarctica.AAC.1
MVPRRCVHVREPSGAVGTISGPTVRCIDLTGLCVTKPRYNVYGFNLGTPGGSRHKGSPGL